MTSWLPVSADSEFSIQNLPFGVVSVKDSPNRRLCATRLGDFVIHLGILEEAGLLPTINAFEDQTTLNAFLKQPKSIWLSTRHRLQELLTTSRDLHDNTALRDASIFPLNNVTTYHLPITVGDYTDFYSSRYHAETVSELFRGNRNLTTQWKRLPVAYHGRASTIFPTGTPIPRPQGQVAVGTTSSAHRASAQLDYELEVAAVVGGGTDGTTMTVFGLVLMNDWSARDLQRFEYVPLGPFTGKNFGTSISPWVVMVEALPQVPRLEIPEDPLEYLQTGDTIFDIELTATLETCHVTAELTKTNYKYLFWTPDQQLAHHSVSGCRMKAGDLLGSGTISGPEGAGGSMLELSRNGATPIALGNGEERTFLQDGDSIVLRGVSVHPDGSRVGFGECRGTVLPVTEGGLQENKAKSTKSYDDFKLYGFQGSSATGRVRVALAAKSIDYTEIPISVMKGDNRTPEFLAKSPLGQVPVLELLDVKSGLKVHITQSLAIIKFLDDAFPATKHLWPQDPVLSALAAEVVEIINSYTQPLQSVAYLQKLESQSEGKLKAFELGQAANEKGLLAMEKRVSQMERKGPFCLGTFAPTVADICLVPQLCNARDRYQLDVNRLFPTLVEIDEVCSKHSWFISASSHK